jgi:RNA polymerase sigma-70 factor, ECF subfamily
VTDDQDNLEQLSDERLAALAQGGAVAAFEVIARRYQVRLLQYLRRRVGRQADAEDVLQETFVRAFEKLHQFRQGFPLRPWLYAIARNCAVLHARRPRLVSSEGIESADERTAGLEEAESRQRLWEIARGLLSEDQYEALWLHYVGELKTGQVAAVMGRSWVSVKTLLVRARRRLAPHAARIYGLDASSLEAATTGGT